MNFQAECWVLMVFWNSRRVVLACQAPCIECCCALLGNGASAHYASFVVSVQSLDMCIAACWGTATLLGGINAACFLPGNGVNSPLGRFALR